MAKKKATRKGASGGARKSTARRRPRKAAARPRVPRVETGLENPKRVNLKPVKSIITAQIKRLEGYAPRPEVETALTLLRETKAALSRACVSSPIPMVIEF